MKLKRITLSHTEQTVYFALLKHGSVVVNSGILASSLKIPFARAKNLLSILAKKGALSRIGKGRYVVIPPDVLYERKSFVQDPYIVVDSFMENLNEKYYIAYQSAAHLHGIAEQLPFIVRAAVLKQRKSFSVGKTKVEYVTLKQKKFFGIQRIRYREYFLNESDLEKTLLDCLDRPEFCGGISEVTRTISNAIERIDKKRLLDYLEKFDNYALAQRLGFVLEKLKKEYPVDESLLKKIERFRSAYVYLLDPFSEKRGKVSKRWNIIENVNCLSW